MDIEGADLDALKGAMDSLKKFKPKICLECEPERFEVDDLHLHLNLDTPSDIEVLRDLAI